MFFPLFGDDNRGKATAWSLFGTATAVAHQDESKRATVQSLNTTVAELTELASNGAKLTSALAGFLGHKDLAERADKVQHLLGK